MERDGTKTLNAENLRQEDDVDSHLELLCRPGIVAFISKNHYIMITFSNDLFDFGAASICYFGKPGSSVVIRVHSLERGDILAPKKLHRIVANFFQRDIGSCKCFGDVLVKRLGSISLLNHR